MHFGSVCSGIEAASIAFAPLGWRAAWLAEIEPFPSAVLAHHTACAQCRAAGTSPNTQQRCQAGHELWATYQQANFAFINQWLAPPLPIALPALVCHQPILADLRHQPLPSLKRLAPIQAVVKPDIRLCRVFIRPAPALACVVVRAVVVHRRDMGSVVGGGDKPGHGGWVSAWLGEPLGHPGAPGRSLPT